MFSITLLTAALLGSSTLGQVADGKKDANLPLAVQKKDANPAQPAQPAEKKKEAAGAQLAEKKKEAVNPAPGTSGVVESVDAGAKTITLKAGKKGGVGISVVVNDQTKFTVQEGNETRQAQFADVTAGKNVTIVHETKDGKEIAKSVTIAVARPKK